MNFIDIIVIGIVGLSALLALSRGFVKEVLSILGWVGALIATFILLPSVEPIAANFIAEPLLAKIAAGAAIFILSLVLCGFANHWISEKVRGHGLSSLDRSLGLLFGLVRGALIVGICYIVFAWAFRDPADWPQAVREAKSLPLVVKMANLIQERLPQGLVERGQSVIDQGIEQGKPLVPLLSVPGIGLPVSPAPDPAAPPPATPAPATPASPNGPVSPNGQSGGSGYNQDERTGLDQLIEGSQ